MYRFVHIETVDDPRLSGEFLSDRETGKRPFAREKAFPELQNGMSAFKSLDAARERWKDMHAMATSRGQEVRAGYFVAELALRPDLGFDIEDLDEVDEHVTIWGSSAMLAGAVNEIYPAAIE